MVYVYTEKLQLDTRVFVFHPATKPVDRKLPLFVAVSIPRQCAKRIDNKDLERLRRHYKERLSIYSTRDGRLCVVHLYQGTRNLKKVSGRANKLRKNIALFLGVNNSLKQSCGYNEILDAIGEPIPLAA